MNSVVKRSIIAGGCLIGFSVVATIALVKFNSPPVEASTPKEVRSLTVKAIQVSPEDVVVNLNGFGEARTKHSVVLSTEVSGRVNFVHPALAGGNVFKEGELLLSIDDSSYIMEREEISAQLEGLQATITKYATEKKHAAQHHATLQRSYELAKTQYDRSVTLLKEGIGNQTRVEESEEKMNAVQNDLEMVQKELSLIPIRIQEVEQSMRADQARFSRAELGIARAKIYAPFHGRVEKADVEVGQYLNAFHDAVTLADDSVLEIPIKLDARSAKQWLRFEAHSENPQLSWFDSVAQVPCEIRWAENSASQAWIGRVDRVEAFDSKSRTLTLIVQYKRGTSATDHEAPFPLVAGMFCEVTVPGQEMKGVFAIPHGAVGLDQEVYLSQENRLMATPVDVMHIAGETAYISKGLSTGDIVVVTRLVNPLNNSLLNLMLDTDDPSSVDASL